MLPKIPEGVGNALDTTTKAAKEFLGKLLGPASEEVGLLLGDQMRFVRFKRSVRILNDAKEFLRQSNIEPQSVPLKMLNPILESGSLEDDDGMLNRWSALLAAAADPERAKNVRVSFPEILKQLSPLEARILDLVFDLINEKQIPRQAWSARGALGAGLRNLLMVEEQDFEIAIDNLYRLRLCSPPSTQLEFIENKEHRFQLSTKEIICITELGYSFVSACKPKTEFKSGTTIPETLLQKAAKLAAEARGMNFRGEWDSEIQYEIKDVVQRGSLGIYIVIQRPPVGAQPETGAPFWFAWPNAPHGVWA